MSARNQTTTRRKASAFRERLNRDEIAVNDFRVDDLRKIASEYDISGSHGMHKQELVDTINRVRRSQPQD